MDNARHPELGSESLLNPFSGSASVSIELQNIHFSYILEEPLKHMQGKKRQLFETLTLIFLCSVQLNLKRAADLPMHC